MTGVQLPTVDCVLTRIAQSGSRPAWRLVSNCVPSLNQPVYWTVTVELGGTIWPVPTVRLMICSPSGNLIGVWLSPAWKSSPPTAGVGVFWLTPAPGGGLGVGSGYPQPATTSAVSAAAATGKKVLESMVGALGYRAGSLARPPNTTPRRQAAAAHAQIAMVMPNLSARTPAPKGPRAKPTAFALATTPNTRACTAAGVSRPIMVEMTGPTVP